MINNTIFGNTSGGGGGGSSFQVNGSVELLNVFNNIIWGNSANGNGSDVYLTGSGLTKLFMFNDANGMYGVWNNALPQLNVDPKFVTRSMTIYGDYHLQTCLALLELWHERHVPAPDGPRRQLAAPTVPRAGGFGLL